MLRTATPEDGRALIRASWAGTAAFLAVSALAVGVPSAWVVAAAVDVVLCLVGVGAFVIAYLIAVGRSRDEAIGMGGLFFLAGNTAPKAVRWSLMSSLAVQIVGGLVLAGFGLASESAAATNPLAFAVLTPMYGLGVAGLWGARHGSFAQRDPAEPVG